MDLKIARNLPNEKPKTISLDKIEATIDKEGQNFFYFDKEMSHKDLLAFVKHFEKKGLSVYHRVVRYGLDEDDYMYEVHIL
ncbi:hypothetical protein DMB92_08355 [Campylobacter sp. MIT 99-7217]|uniref:HP0268 family nuclease n=1 Tax=Campylobacter sp. MIT 99-7217 TaxID=535091 RepID=UPI00115749D7|nr:HP0268 family nuclease [Campylobacter sp. MIT 99-7217]TQR29364.1 hypothetical protein DMB92_08355 [Campylobacter sp. MIT 99-7217]